MDPEFLNRLQRRSGDIHQQRAAEQQARASQEAYARQQELNEANRIAQEKALKLARITALSSELWTSVPGLAHKLETLRIATKGGQTKSYVLAPDDSGIHWEAYRPNGLYSWDLDSNSYAILYLFPFNSKTGNTLVPTGTKMVEYSGTPPSRMGNGTPGGRYEKALFGIQHSDISDQLGISLKTNIQSPDQNEFTFKVYFHHLHYEPLTDYNLRFTEFSSGFSIFKKTIYTPQSDYMYTPSLMTFHYPLPQDQFGQLSPLFEQGCSSLYDRYLQTTHQI
jgi:hypothetical protein